MMEKVTEIRIDDILRYIQKQMTNGYFMPNNTPNEENIQFQYQKMED